MSREASLKSVEPAKRQKLQPMPYRSWVEVSRPQIAANYAAIRKVVGPDVEIMPVVKADAYRHGAIEVSRTLENQGARWLAVSNTDEGVALRDAGIKARILVMADFLPFSREALLAYGLTPVIHTVEDIAELDRLACRRQETVRFHLKIDSGLSRLGIRTDAARIAATILAARNLELEGLMTHFASAANYASKQTEDQIHAFDQICRDPSKRRSISEICPPLRHRPYCLRTQSSLARNGAAGSRHLWLRFPYPGPCSRADA